MDRIYSYSLEVRKFLQDLDILPSFSVRRPSFPEHKAVRSPGTWYTELGYMRPEENKEMQGWVIIFWDIINNNNTGAELSNIVWWLNDIMVPDSAGNFSKKFSSFRPCLICVTNGYINVELSLTRSRLWVRIFARLDLCTVSTFHGLHAGSCEKECCSWEGVSALSFRHSVLLQGP